MGKIKFTFRFALVITCSPSFFFPLSLFLSVPVIFCVSVPPSRSQWALPHHYHSPALPGPCRGIPEWLNGSESKSLPVFFKNKKWIFYCDYIKCMGLPAVTSATLFSYTDLSLGQDCKKVYKVVKACENRCCCTRADWEPAPVLQLVISVWCQTLS